MTKLKYILFSSLLGVFLYCSTPSLAQEGFQAPEPLWKRGDHIIVRAVCKDEKDIMEMVGVDTRGGLPEIMLLFKTKVHADECRMLSKPSMFVVYSIVITYVDYLKTESVALSLGTVDDENTIVAYTIARGRPASPKQKYY
jgi:hypothetical protein